MKHSPGKDKTDNAQWIRAALERFEGPLTMYAVKLVGDVDRARDIVQDTFLKLWTADRAGVDGHLAQWLYRVCRNRALDVCRKEGRMTTLQNQHIESREQVQPEAGDASREESGGVMAALQTLSDKQQEVLRLKFQGNLSYQEIANVMDITANHVGVLIHTALKTIRERLACSDMKSASSQTSAWSSP